MQRAFSIKSFTRAIDIGFLAHCYLRECVMCVRYTLYVILCICGFRHLNCLYLWFFEHIEKESRGQLTRICHRYIRTENHTCLKRSRRFPCHLCTNGLHTQTVISRFYRINWRKCKKMCQLSWRKTFFFWHLFFELKKSIRKGQLLTT